MSVSIKHHKHPDSEVISTEEPVCICMASVDFLQLK